MTPAAVAERHRRDIDDLVRLAQTDLGFVLATYTGDAEAARDALAVALPALVDVYGSADFKSHDHCRCVAVPEFG